MKKLIILAVFLTACAGIGIPPVQAEVKTFQITPSTTSIDGELLTVPVLSMIYCGTSSGVYAEPTDIGEVLDFPINNVLSVYPDGKVWCVASAYITGLCNDMDALLKCEGPMSNEINILKQNGRYYGGNEPNKSVFGVK